MGLITAFNAVLECIVTGAAAALFILWFAKMGWFPMLGIVMTPEDVEDKDDETL